MIMRRERLGKKPAVFRALTGLTVAVFDQLVADLTPAFHTARRRRLDRPDRQRAFGCGDDFDLTSMGQFLLTIVWLRHYPTQEALVRAGARASACRSVAHGRRRAGRRGRGGVRLARAGGGIPQDALQSTARRPTQPAPVKSTCS